MAEEEAVAVGVEADPQGGAGGMVGEPDAQCVDLVLGRGVGEAQLAEQGYDGVWGVAVWVVWWRRLRSVAAGGGGSGVVIVVGCLVVAGLVE